MNMSNLIVNISQIPAQHLKDYACIPKDKLSEVLSGFVTSTIYVKPIIFIIVSIIFGLVEYMIFYDIKCNGNKIFIDHKINEKFYVKVDSHIILQQFIVIKFLCLIIAIILLYMRMKVYA